MSAAKKREWHDEEAVRDYVPLWLGLYGPSSSGKTMSALRLATGIQRVTKGEIFFIDTELGRGKHYAPPPGAPAIPGKHFKFRHVPFEAPFTSDAYLDAFRYCVSKGATVLVVDSMSHEHNGIGGYLEQADAIGGSNPSPGKYAKPAAARLRAKNGAVQLGVHIVFCFRGKDKIELKKGEDPRKLGMLPEGGDAWLWEMTAQCLLRPRAEGVPTWRGANKDENLRVKLPEQFKHLLTTNEQLSEDMGEAMAKWAAGGAMGPFESIAVQVSVAETPEQVEKLAAAAKAAVRSMNRLEALALSNAIAARREWVSPDARSRRDEEEARLEAVRKRREEEDRQELAEVRELLRAQLGKEPLDEEVAAELARRHAKPAAKDEAREPGSDG